MALDGITIYNIIFELKNQLLGGRIDKIYQPQKDEIILSVRSIGANYKLLLSANPSHPRVHITKIQKNNPMVPPTFCMVLRKYIAGGKITNITQPNFERIINIEIESANEMGDMAVKKIVIEIMGKHSNIILIDENQKVIDSIKRISHDKSSVREVLPGSIYKLPPSQDKRNPLFLDKEDFFETINSNPGQQLQKIIYKSYTGISPIMSSEICFRAGIYESAIAGEVSQFKTENLFTYFNDIFSEIKNNRFTPEIILNPKGNKIIDFSPIHMKQFENFKIKSYNSISVLLEDFYNEKDNMYHIQQKAHNIRKLVASKIERCVKKMDLQNQTLKDIAKMDKWKLLGELITANIYSIKLGMTSFKAINFYDEACPETEIKLDPNLTPSENAQKYFNKYNKAKRTKSALDIQIKQTSDELRYLEGILNSIENSSDESDLDEIKEELISQGYMKKKKSNIKNNNKQKSRPMHYTSSDGLDIYIGKSNIQNDELTLKFAENSDLWLHTKNIPGSHVIIKMNGAQSVPDSTLLEAASLAAFYSKAKNSGNVPVDYALKKYVKKPGGAKPGMVIYEHNKTIYVTPEEDFILSINKQK